MRILVRRFRVAVERLEEIPLGPAGWVAGFLGIVATRHFLELRSSGFPVFHASAFYVHYVLAYLGPLLALSLVLALFSGVRLERVLRLMLLAWALTLIPPLVDSLASQAHEAKIGYMELGETPLATVLLRFFDPRYHLEGTTPGIRFEAAVACLLGAVYAALRSDSRRLARAAGVTIAVYLTSLFFFTLPHLFIRMFRQIRPGLTWDSLYNAAGLVPRPESLEVRTDQGILLYLVPLTLVLAAAALAATRRSLLKRIAAAMGSSEGWIWGAAFLLGCFAGWRILDGVPRPGVFVLFDGLAVGAGALALLLAGAALALFDGAEGGDPPADRRAAGGVLLLAAAILAPSASKDFAAFAAVVLGSGLLARGLPRILPRVYLAPQAAAGVSTLAAFTAGYALRAGDEAVTLLPASLYLLLFLLGTVADLARLAPTSAGIPRALVRVIVSSAPILALAAHMAAIRIRPSLAPIAGAVILAAAALVASHSLPPRQTSFVALVSAVVVVGMQIAAPPAAAAWRAKALDSQTYLLRASFRAEQAGDLAAAAGAASEAVRRAPGSSKAHARLGMVRLKRGDPQSALEALERAAALDPGNLPLQENIATVLLEAERPDQALSRVDAILAREPFRFTSLFIRAQGLDALNRTLEADAAWRAYIDVAEGLPDEAAYLEVARQRLAIGAAPAAP